MQKAKLLIVEDEALIALDIRMSFSELGHNAYKIVSNGQAAIKSVENDNPDILMLDIHLFGEMDGIDTALRIRSFSDIPIIFMTGYSIEGVLDRTKDIKPIGLFEKPIDVSTISNLIDSVLAKK